MKRMLFLCLFALPCLSQGEETSLKCVIQATVALSHNQTIQKELIKYNHNPNDPLQMDARWNSLTPDSTEISSIIHNPATPPINTLIHHYSIQGEGFLIGLNGGLVAATNKTSDYYQGDEDQFTKALKLPAGNAWTEKHITDKSANALLVKIAVPVYRRDKPGAQQAIGVLVVGLDEFVMETFDDCR